MTSRLLTEIRRLYQLPGEVLSASDAALRLVGAEGLVRTMVVGLSGPADWTVLSSVWRGVQADLALPAPAIAVNGVDAYELWFSLAEPTPLAQVAAFLEGLRHRYLPDVKSGRVQMRPSATSGAAAQTTPLIPASQGDTGNWAAFVAPDLAAVFGDQPMLDLPPGNDAQADLLSRMSSIGPAQFDEALAQIAGREKRPESPSMRDVASDAVAPGSGGSAQEEARAFLQNVMNDAAVPMGLRIDAAKALLSVPAVRSDGAPGLEKRPL